MPLPSVPTQRVRLHAVPVREWLWLTLAMAVGLVLRVPFFRIAMVADEGGYAYATRGWIEGTGKLYDDLWISRPQGIFLVYAGIFDLFGTDTVALRFAAWIAVAVTTFCIWAFTRMWLSPKAAILAAFVLVIISGSPELEGYTANAEVFMGAPAALSALWLLHARRTGWHRLSLVGIGVTIGVATSLKPSGLVMAPLAIAFIVLVDVVPWRVVLTRLGWLALGGGLVVAATLLHGWYLGWDNFIYATLTYRLHAQSGFTVGLDYNLQQLGRLIQREMALITLITLVFILLHYAGLTRFFVSRSPRWRMRSPRLLFRLLRSWLGNPGRLRRGRWDDGTLLLTLWLFGAVFGMSIGGDWWAHYVIQLTAPLAIWLSYAILTILTDLTVWGRRIFVAVAVVLMLQPYAVIRHWSVEEMEQDMFSHPGYPAQAEVAAYIREHTEPGTTIYVAFDQASIYYLADRPPAYRHLYDQELRGIPSSYSDILAIIESPDRPEYIIGTRQPGPFPDNSELFWQRVGIYYFRETTIDGVLIYRAKP